MLKPQLTRLGHRSALSTAGSVSAVSLLNLLFLIPAFSVFETFKVLETPRGETQCEVKSVGEEKRWTAVKARSNLVFEARAKRGYSASASVLWYININLNREVNDSRTHLASSFCTTFACVFSNTTESIQQHKEDLHPVIFYSLVSLSY